MKDDYKDNHSNHHKKDKGNWHYNTTPFIIINQKISIRNVITILVNDETGLRNGQQRNQQTNTHAQWQPRRCVFVRGQQRSHPET